MDDIEVLQKASTLVDEKTPSDEFENAIRRFGIINACEWFGYQSDSEFTKDTILHLARSSL